MLLPDSSTSAPVAVVTSQVQASKAYGLLSSLSFPPPLAGIHSGGTSSGWYRGSSSPTARKVSVPLLVEDRSTHQVVSLAAQQAMPSMGCLSRAWGNFEFSSFVRGILDFQPRSSVSLGSLLERLRLHCRKHIRSVLQHSVLRQPHSHAQ
jgi:hypothetical protein